MKKLPFLLFAIIFLYAAGSCRKEDKEPPQFRAASLTAGRAGIRFTSDKAFNGSKSFDVNNTAGTTATSDTLGPIARTIKLETTELSDTTPTRKVIIDILVRSTNSGTISINLAPPPRSGIPMAVIRMESYSIFGIFRESVSGVLTITRLTDTEIEGSFTAAMDDGMNISNGSFAGRF